jgi:heme/copper-type cytochrome/quinol oxidase subunit 2
LKYNKNQDVVYYDNNGDVKTKNLYIDNAEIEIKNNSIVDINIINSQTEANFWTILLISVAIVVFVIIAVFVVLYFFKKRRNWEQI